MRNLKKFLALVLALMMTFSLMVTVNAADLTDIKDTHDNFSEAVQVLNGMGVFRGYEDGTFKPDRTITRAEAATIVYRLATADTDDSMAHLFEDSAVKQFVDVSADHWAAGYIGYCVNNGLVVGYDDTHFGPSDKVTGVQVLAMILRAVGYGQNKEFEGPAWATNVYGVARAKGLLTNVDKTSYTGKLTQEAPRELIAELLFQAAQIPTVTYTMLGGYNENSMLLGNGKDNPSLGVANFGLTANSGIILGNQETGEIATKVGYTLADGEDAETGHYNYSAVASTKTSTDGNYLLTCDAATTLADYGHMTKVWYDNRGGATKHTYATLDLAKSATVYASGDVNPAAAGNLGKAAAAAGFTVSKNAASIQWSGEYSQFTTGDVTTESAIKTYTLIDNTGNGGIDAIIRLNAEVVKITETKTTAVPQTISFTEAGGNKAASQFVCNDGDDGDGATGTLRSSDPKNQVLPGSVTKLGEIVTAWQIKGSKVAFKDTIEFKGTDYAVLKNPLKTVQGTVSTYKVGEGKVTSVNANIDGKTQTIQRSGILEGEQAIAYYADKGPTPNEINPGSTYIFVLDDADRFVAIIPPNDYTFLYATYADFQYGELGTGDIDYMVYGINWEGKRVDAHDLTTLTIGKKFFANYMDDEDSLGAGYAGMLEINKKNMANNNVTYGHNAAFWINEDGDMVKGGEDGQLANGTKWMVTNADAANGFAKVVNNGTEYMLTSDTVFYVVSSFGVNAKVQVYNGLKELVGDGTSAVISYTSGGDEVWYKLADHQFDSVVTGKNNTVTKVILSASNLRSYSAQNLYFVEAGTGETGVVMADLKTAKQYEMWLNGVQGTYWLTGDTAKKLEDYTLSGDTGVNVFVTLSKATTTRSGVTVYDAEVLTTESSPKTGRPGVGGVCEPNAETDSLKYEYVMVNEYEKAKIGSDIMNVKGAVVADVEYAHGDVTSRVEIKSVEQLNKAVSTGYTVQVAIVNSGINVTTIYVLSVE